MPRITALALAIASAATLTDLALAGAHHAALAALALVSVVATAKLGRGRRLASHAYQRGYRHASGQQL